ncbi:MAG: hypothetical protein Kow00127_05450 [Bacteroidales bacterium]
MRNLTLIVLLSLVGTSSLFGQLRSRYSGYQTEYFGAGVDVGLTKFFGDLDESAAMSDPWSNNRAMQIRALRSFNNLLELQGRVSFGNISGEKNAADINGAYRWFQTKFIEYTIDGGVNLLGFFRNTYDFPLGVYFKLGIGLIDFKTRLYDGATGNLIRELGYEKTTTELVIPVGLVFMYHISESSAIQMQLTQSRVNTDKLDIVSNSNSDYYAFIALGYTFKFLHSDGHQNRILRGRRPGW